MQRSSRFRVQHKELARLGAAVFEAFREPGFARDVLPALRALARFTGKLKVHAAMEDEALYPWLERHENRELRDIAEVMRVSVGPIYREFFAFEAAWTPDAARADPQGFAAATGGLLLLLNERMDRENREMYDVLDAHDDTPFV